MKKKTVLPFLGGYLALLLGLALLFIPFANLCLSLFEEKQLVITQQRLQSGLEQLEQQIESLHSIAFSVGHDAEYRTFARRNAETFVPSDYYHLQKLYTEFSRLCLAHPYVQDYGLLFQNDILLTRERIHFPFDGSYGTLIRFGDLDREAFLKTFGHPEKLSMLLPDMKVYNGNVEYQAVIWLCSMSEMQSPDPTGVCFATFSRETLAELLMAELDRSQTGVVLMNASGEPLMQIDSLKPMDQPHVLRASIAYGLSAELSLSDAQFTGMLSPVRNMLFVSFGLLAMAGVVMSALLAVRASRPLRRLIALVRQVDAADTQQAGGSYEWIGNTVTRLASSVDQYRQALAAQKLYVRDRVFEALLRETPVREGAISQRRMEEFGQCFPGFPEKYRLAIIRVQHEENSVEERPRQQIVLMGLIESQLSPAPYVYFSGNQAVLALDCTGEYGWPQQLAQLRTSAKESFALALTIALSDEDTGCETLHAQYQSARGILTLAGQEEELLEVWQRQNFPDQAGELALDYSEMAQLHTLLLRAEKAGALSLMRRVTQSMTSASALNEVMNRQLYYNLRGVLLRVKLERLETLNSLDIPDYHSELDHRKCFAQLEKCCETACDLLLPTIVRRQTAFAVSVNRFIDENLGNSALSVGLVAEHFAISEPTVQKTVRQEKNCSFFEYVEQQRYEKALQLLQTTQIPIARVAEECGFNSISAFYKAFKRKSTMPPAAIRQQCQG